MPTRTVQMAVFFLLLLGLVAVAAPHLVGPPSHQVVQAARAQPSLENPFGRDALGRDLLSRIVFGARISLAVGLSSALMAVVFGTLVGAVSAYIGGLTDQLLMRLVDLCYAFPALVMIVLLKELIERGNPERGLWAIILALSLYSWMQVARIVRGEVLRLRQMPFVDAARTSGFGNLRILFFHILPNTWGILLVAVMLRVPLNILAESMLGFVGLGVKAPIPSWGTLASEGWTAMRFYPHLILFPSAVLFLTILSLTTVAEHLRLRQK